MSKRECDIIKDLLPSYADGICSEASKEWIEEHLKECEECRALAEVMKNSEFSAKRLEQEQFDAVKKIVMQNLRRSVFGLGFCFLLLLVVVYVQGYNRYYGQVPMAVLYVAMPICMAMSWLVGRSQTKQRQWNRWDAASLAIVVLSAGYGAGLMFFGLPRIQETKPLFGISWTKIGPFVNTNLLVCLGICFLLYLAQMVFLIKKGKNSSVIINLCLMVMFLFLNYHFHLGVIESFEGTIRSLGISTLLTLGIGGVGTVLFAFLDKRTQK